MEIKCSYTKLMRVEDIVPHPGNENKHNESQIEVLARIIAKDGMRHPIIISKLSGYVVAGHGRLEALKLLGESEAPVDFQEFDDPVQELRVRTADNNIARYSEFDRDLMIENIKEFDIDIEDVEWEEFGIIPVEFKDGIDDHDEDDLGSDFNESGDNGGKEKKQVICPHCGGVV